MLSPTVAMTLIGWPAPSASFARARAKVSLELITKAKFGKSLGVLGLERVGINDNFFAERRTHFAGVERDRAGGAWCDLALRALPDNGLGYGVLRYLNPQTAAHLEGFASPQIGFNYLGRFAAWRLRTGAAPTRRCGLAPATRRGGAGLHRPGRFRIDRSRPGRQIAHLGGDHGHRSSSLPDISAMADFLPGYEASTFFGIGAPMGTPAEVIDKLDTEINAGRADPTLKGRIAVLGGAVLPGSPAEFGKLLVEEGEKWARVIKFANIKGD